MNERIAIKEIQKIAEAMQSFKAHQALLVSFLPPLTALNHFLKNTNKTLIDENFGLSENEITEFETIAQMFHILSYHCIHNNPTPDTLALAQACSDIENTCLTTAQHGKGLLNENAGQFYASEQNLAAVTQASLDVLKATNTKEPVNFIEII